tara:strand:+ start:195 stop:1877 length:1683 start_codon:yes stop_codon:yes gene_type:complete
MIAKNLKIILIIFFIFFPLGAKSKNIYSKDFNSKELSNYFSGIISHNNQKNEQALKYLKSSKQLLNKHDEYFRRLIFSLVLNQNVDRAIQEIKFLKNKKQSEFFEAQLILLIDSINKKNFDKTKIYLNSIAKYTEDGTFEKVIYETLRDYAYTFKEKKMSNFKSNFGNLVAINNAFQSCYLNNPKTLDYFGKLKSSEAADYSRYLFFYVNYLIHKKRFDLVKEISFEIDELSSNLIILQTKSWIDKSNFSEIKEIFSCNNENDILAEFFYLVSNLYSSQDEYEQSNFYLNISYFLNKKFKINLSLMADNYFLNENYDQSLKVLQLFNSKDDLYYWFKIKQEAKIITEKTNKEEGLKYIEKNFKNIKNPSTKVLFDLATIYKNSKKYEKAIELYTSVMNIMDKDDLNYADLLYRRGGSFERIGKYEKSDKDLLDALKIIPNNSYVLNYLAYSWLERNQNINKAILMLEKAYKENENDPYIIDSVGWGYFLVGKYNDAEKYMRRALELMPNDPIVNDHYGDILWKLDRKIQAQYFWNSVLKMDDAEKEMIEKIKAKLINGLS